MSDVFDPRLEEHRSDPYPLFRRMREREPSYDPHLKGWIVTRHADVKLLLADRTLSSDRLGYLCTHLSPVQQRAIPHLLSLVGAWPNFSDPPAHTGLRRLVNHALNPRLIERHAPSIQATIDRLIERVAPSRRMDAIADFAFPLPVLVIMTLLGVPDPDLPFLKRQSDDLALFLGSASRADGHYERAEAAARALLDYFLPFVRERRARPRDDALSALLSDPSAPPDETHVAAIAVSLMFAGHETTTNLIGTGLLTLIRNPEAMAAIRANPDLLEPAIEEMLRHEGPIAAMTRIVREPLVLGNAELRPGDRVFVFLNAANHDERLHVDPDRFDLARNSKAHVAFGHGIHFCAGAALARLEARLAFTTILTRLRSIAVAGDIHWYPSLVFRGVESLPITFELMEGA